MCLSTLNNSEESSGVQGIHNHPEIYLDPELIDNEPPYFLRQHISSNTLNAVSESTPHVLPHHTHGHGYSMPQISRSATSSGSTDDFRSVIDDLTIENKKLRDRLRKYEASYSAHLEKDKLFEVKIHGLPGKEKRELEETLRSFTASLKESLDTDGTVVSGDTRHHILVSTKKMPLSSSISRPVDSGYTSMSKSGPTSISTLNRIGADRAAYNQQNTNNQNVQSFLHNSPEGQLPKNSPIMTEEQKKKLVVRRLEQLFTGKKGSAGGEHSQPMQQQEVSESAAMADRAASSKWSSVGGLREAPISPSETEVATKGSPRPADDLRHETNNPGGVSDSIADVNPLEQRPTRPLDLDPDRPQIPADNVEYIRHLGFSTPSFGRGIADDIGAIGEGWVYLNLLINMAQLHILNVTPDFVRAAVADLSDKFELSPDGRKVRWTGGTDGTDARSGQNRSPMASDSLGGADRERRKPHVGRFASIPTDIMDQNVLPSTKQQNPLFYKPLFHYQGSSTEDSTSDGGSESPSGSGYSHADESGTRRVGRVPRLLSRGSHSMCGRRIRRRDNGSIAFYSGALFCTDLSGDGGTISTPLHETAIGRDGDSNHAIDPLGCCSRKVAPNISRTPSGSSLPFRPFKDYSKGSDPLQPSETRSKTPDLLDEDSDTSLELEASRLAPVKSPLELGASGLGGTQPADHFIVRVETRRTIPSHHHTQAKLSRSVPAASPRKPPQTFPNPTNPENTITLGLASLNASSPLKASELGNMPVQTEIVSAQFTRLPPSALPPPLGCYATLSSSDSDSDSDSDSNGSSSSFVGNARSRAQKAPRSYKSVSRHASSLSLTRDSIEREQDFGKTQDDDSSDDYDEHDDDDDDDDRS